MTSKDYNGQPVPQRASVPAKAIEDGMLAARELRRWHWRKAVSARNTAQRYDSTGSGDRRELRRLARMAHQQADFHIRAVQVLNDLCPVDTTAEQDEHLLPPTRTVNGRFR